MNTTKKLIVLCLAALMCLISIMPATFSWYNHSDIQCGEKIKYERSGLPISYADNSKITMKTEKLEMADANNVKFDDKGDLIPDGLIGQTNTISHEHCQYYRTTLENSGSSDVFVSLYLSEITNNPKVFVGAVAPTITERGFSARASASRALNGITRVYFQCRSASDWSTASSISVVPIVNGTEQNAVNMSNTYTSGGSSYTLMDGTNVTWYANLPAGTTQFYFKNPSVSASSDWSRTQDILDYKPGTVFYLTGDTSDEGSHRYAQFKTKHIDNLINITRYYDSVAINAGQSVSIALRSSDYTGNANVTYSLVGGTSGSPISVNEDTGVISCTSAISGTKTVNIKVLSSLGDELVIPVSVSTPANLASVPVSQNIKVPAQKTEDGETINGKVQVEWYVRNEDASNNVSFNGIFFTR